jgi:hypothetical protein
VQVNSDVVFRHVDKLIVGKNDSCTAVDLRTSRRVLFKNAPEVALANDKITG